MQMVGVFYLQLEDKIVQYLLNLNKLSAIAYGYEPRVEHHGMTENNSYSRLIISLLIIHNN